MIQCCVKTSPTGAISPAALAAAAGTGFSAAGLIEFPNIHNDLVMAHTQAASQRIGSLLSDIPGKEINALSES